MGEMSFPTGDPVFQSGPAEQHVYHHTEPSPAKINVKIERNTKGYNFEVTVTGASSVDEALALISDANAKLKEQYGG
jgi:hypothetical protein